MLCILKIFFHCFQSLLNVPILFPLLFFQNFVNFCYLKIILKFFSKIFNTFTFNFHVCFLQELNRAQSLFLSRKFQKQLLQSIPIRICLFNELENHNSGFQTFPPKYELLFFLGKGVGEYIFYFFLSRDILILQKSSSASA